MSDNASQERSFYGPLDDERKLNNVVHSITIHIPHTHGNSIFHVTSIMLQIKGTFGWKAY